MANKEGHNCQALISDENGTRFIYVSRERAFIVAATNDKCIGQVVVEDDTDGRVSFGVNRSDCIIGSWRKGIKAVNYETDAKLWSSPLNEFNHIGRHGPNKELKLRKDGTIILDSDSGVFKEAFKCWDIYVHPRAEATASYGLVHKKLVVESGRFKTKCTLDGKSFTIYGHAWSDSEFVWSSPAGDLCGYSFAEGRLMFQIKPHYWFNVPLLGYDLKSKQFVGIATDWGGKPNLGLFGITPASGKIDLLRVLPNENCFCFLDHGRILLLEDGSRYSTSDGNSLAAIDWRKMLRC